MKKNIIQEWPAIVQSSRKIYYSLDNIDIYEETTGDQVALRDFQNKGRRIVLEVPLRNLLTSICNFLPCDRVV